MARRRQAKVDLDMTPMIDVVFQLIIFFIVTINLEDTYDPTIELAKAESAPKIEGKDNHPLTLVIEVNRRGDISLHRAVFTERAFHGLIQRRYNKYGAFPVLIRGDKGAKHEAIRKVMDICASVGIWKINFAAIVEEAM